MKRGVYTKESRLFSKGKESWLKKNRVVREIGGGGGGGWVNHSVRLREGNDVWIELSIEDSTVLSLTVRPQSS